MATEMRCFLQTAQGRAVMEEQRKRKTILPDPGSIYFDFFCSVTPGCLRVKQFFYPSKLPLAVPWENIKKLYYYGQKAEGEVSIGYDKEGVWWASDEFRVKKRQIIVHNVRIERNVEPSRIGFTVHHIVPFLEACRMLLPFECHVSGEF
ncbi:unnamed protein product [Caenorhabditis auriculariae]|uniref:Uncharacterized protein n=1 Tax=Caenorhabditis auriculariae TaxID=2777116 RepID=A0A8S1HLH8_9PELO|nr:unnamed protein product [Caenorhabditis auriculariae]